MSNDQPSSDDSIKVHIGYITKTVGKIETDVSVLTGTIVEQGKQMVNHAARLDTAERDIGKHDESIEGLKKTNNRWNFINSAGVSVMGAVAYLQAKFGA